MSEGKKVRWTIATARQNLPALVGLAAREPQDIYRRDTLVARVVDPSSTPQPQGRRSAAELLAELQRACAEEGYTLDVPPRRDRTNPFAARQRGTKRAARTRKP